MRKAEIISIMHEAIVKYLRNGNRRKSLKIDMSLDAIKQTVPTKLFDLGLANVLQDSYNMNFSESERCAYFILRMIDDDIRKQYYTYYKKERE